MFWGIILEPGKKYTSVVEETFHLSTAALDVKSAKNETVTSVKLQLNEQKMILCSLSKPYVMQCSLDLVFPKGTELTFFADGDAAVHLTGYVITPDEDDLLDEESEVSESEEESIPNKSAQEASKINAKALGDSKLTPKSALKKESPEKRKLESNQKLPKKKTKLVSNLPDENGMDSSDDEELSDTDDELDESSKFDFSEDDIEDEDDSDLEEEEDEDEDTEDEEDETDSNGSSSGEVPNKLQTPKPSKSQDQKTPAQDKKTPKTPVSSKKQGKQNKEAQNVANGATPKSEKKDKNKSPKSENKTNKAKDSISGTPQSQKKQTLEGGVIAEDLKIGNGPIAKPGRMLTVFYTGRLKSNNRVFDQTNTGAGFKFRLGRNEVIKGWDVGLNGMKVGSKRRITCPASMAYGSKGSPPNIPPNSTLVFDVELKSVN